MIEIVRRRLQPIFRRAPRLRSLALEAIDVAVRPILLPFRLTRPESAAARNAALAARTDELNRAAETYYAEHADAKKLLDKPFSEPDALPRRLVDAGVLIDAMRLMPGDTVLDLGAGACWLSHLLNRFGCRTISVDVSHSALAIGRQLFDRDPRTNWTLSPEFLQYDGWTLPLADSSVDRVLLYDAYHHLPNPGRLMQEMRRVLSPDGIVGMSEPGRGHAESAPSVAEAAATGVLENELALEDIADLALASGFRAARVVAAGRPPAFEIDAFELRAFMGGRGFAKYWKDLCANLDGHHYLLLFAGDPVPTTRRPKLLRASIRCVQAHVERRRLVMELHNAGNTRWLAAEARPGWTRLGAHLLRDGSLVDFDWLRTALPADVHPDRTVRVGVELPEIRARGHYTIAFDLVIEGVTWFADRGSRPFEVPWPVA
jgi:SAM-dependent methyltransferase